MEKKGRNYNNSSIINKKQKHVYVREIIDWPIAIVTLWSLDAYCDDTASIMTAKSDIYSFLTKMEYPKQKLKYNNFSRIYILLFFSSYVKKITPLSSLSTITWQKKQNISRSNIEQHCVTHELERLNI